MDAGSSVSRRTRSSEADYFRKLHALKQNRDLHDSNIDGGCSIKNLDKIQESESVDDDSDDHVEKKKKKRREYVLNKQGPRKAGRPAKKRARGVGEIDFASLLEAGYGCTEKDLMMMRESSPVSVDVRESSPVSVDVRESALPLKFKFEEEEEDEKEEETEFEKEIHRLFNDLEVGLWESESLQTPADSSVTDDKSVSLDESPAARCNRGEHEEFLDEQIGIICIYCRAILLDIKYVLPPFHVESPERGEWKKREELKNDDDDDDDDDDQIQFNDASKCGNFKPNETTPLKGTVFDLIPRSEKELYPHQLEGFKVMWRNIAGDIIIKNLGTLPREGGQGCIISHAPGTGKTRLTIVFLQTFMRLYPGCRPVIIAPLGVLPTWEQELSKWNSGIEFHNLHDTKLSDQEKHLVGQQQQHKGTESTRLMKLLCWLKGGGSLLGVGYRLFEELSNNPKFKKTLLESPTLLVLDEGHTPRNHNSLMWEALSKVSTKRRIILSGTPFQNNLEELHNTLSLVNPNLPRPPFIPTNTSATPHQINQLRSLIQPFVHIHKPTITTTPLPGITHSLIMLKPTPLQQKLLPKARHNYLKQDYLASLISLHPSLVSEKEEFRAHKPMLQSLQLDPDAGVKTRFLIELIHLSSLLDEKVLIFSEFLEPLRHLKKLLKSHFKWSQGREVVYIDGEVSMKERQRVITRFNEGESESKVMLASQRACCEGISLVGASRVVLLDVSWNPSVQRQAVCRAYRLGQHKMVYVYHLLTFMELTKYAAQAQKDRISDLIFSPPTPTQAQAHTQSLLSSCSEDRVLEAMLRHQASAAMFERIIHHPKDSDFIKDLALDLHS